jgi:CHAD domain-containing protein
MAHPHREVEDTYDVDLEAEPSGLETVPAVASVATPVEHELQATYFDTPALDLAAAGATLRRRTGGRDDGWHLKLPAASGRHELQLPLGRATRTPPKRFRDGLHSLTRGEPLVPVAVVRTHRTERSLLGGDGVVLAELADDRVTAERLPTAVAPGATSSWREWEVELVGGEPGLLEAVGAVLVDRGARPAVLASKLARALGDRIPAATGTRRLGGDDPAAEVVAARLAEQVRALRRLDPLVRLDLSGGVHDMRVAIRRLRAALATYRPLVDSQVTEPLRRELKWLATELAGARDVEVQQDLLGERLAAMAVHEEPEALRGPVAAALGDLLRERSALARERAVAALGSVRYDGLLDGLDRLLERPPWTDLAGRSAHDELRERVRHDWSRLEGRVDAANHTEDATERARLLHEVRKAAKRARYAAEPLVPLYGKDAKRFVRALRRVQSTLGDHHDALVTTYLLRELADRVSADGDNAFTLGVLHERERARMADLEQRFERAWSKASRTRLRRWLV